MVTVMIVCLAISITSAAEVLVPDWSGRYLLIGIAITAIEAAYSFRVLRLPRSRGISLVRYRLAEACLLGIVLKIITYLGYSWDGIRTELSAMLAQPSVLFSSDYMLLIAAAWLTWLMVNRTMVDFEALRDPYASQDEQLAPRERLMARFYWGGGLLVLFIGIRYLAVGSGISEVFTLRGLSQADTGGYHLNALLYFILGTMLLIRIRLTSLKTGWRLQNIDVASDFGKTWTQYGLVFLASIVLIVAVLPTRYSMGLFDTALFGLQVLAGVMRRLMELMMMAITLPLAWLLSLFGQGEGGAMPPAPAIEALITAPKPKSETPFPWEMIRAAAFWLTFLAVAVYMIRSYLEDHPELAEALKKLTFVHWIFSAAAALITLFTKWLKHGLTLPLKVAARRSTAAGPHQAKLKTRWGWGRSRARSHRERVIFAYLQMLQHGAAAGLRRRPHQTPNEYASNLYQALPEVEGDIHALTDVFVQARYSPDPVDQGQAERAITHGERVQDALRHFHKRSTEGRPRE